MSSRSIFSALLMPREQRREVEGLHISSYVVLRNGAALANSSIPALVMILEERPALEQCLNG
jgi:hypothetical protein